MAGFADLPAVGNTDGDIRFIYNRKELWMWNTTAAQWQVITNGTSIFREDFTSTAGQTVFTLSKIIYTPGSHTLTVYKDGLLLYVGALNDYLETNTTTVTFNNALIAGRRITFICNMPSSNPIGVVDSFVATAAQTAFTVTAYTTGNNEIEVYRNGLLMLIGGTNDYVETNPTTITFNYALLAGDIVVVRKNGKIFVPNVVEDWVYRNAGQISAYAGFTAPVGWLMCDGASVLRASYSILFTTLTKSTTVTITIAAPGEVSWTGHGLLTGDCISFETTGALPTGLSVGTNYYVIYENVNTFWVATTYANALAATKITTSGSQSGVHTCRFNPYGIADGTHFNVPDLIGAVPRGSGLSTGYTANVTTNLGHKDDDKMQGHRHAFWPGTGAGTAFPTFTTANVGSATYTGVPQDDLTNGTPRTGTETKMKNVGVNYIIKY